MSLEAACQRERNVIRFITRLKNTERHIRFECPRACKYCYGTKWLKQTR